MSICRKLLETLKAATVERQVEDAYNEMLKAEFPDLELTYPYGCDGYFEFDAGWYQVKAILKEYMPEELKNFRELTKKLADRMRPAVYGLGFLRK